MGHIVDPANGQKHMTGVQTAGGAGRAGGSADTLHIQQKQQTLALDALEAEADITGQTVDAVTIECAVGDGGKTADQLIPQSGHPGGIGVQIGNGLFQSCGHTHDGRQIFCAGTLAALLSAAVNDVGQGDAPADIQGTHALGAVEFVAGKAQHIDVLGFHIDVQMTHGLHRIGVEQHACFLAHCADFADGQHGADLVVGVHHSDQAGVFPNGITHLLSGDVVVVLHIQQSDLKALFFQSVQGVQHRVMLKGGGNDVLFALASPQTGGRDDGLVIGFAAAGGEDDFPRLAAKSLGYLGTGFFQHFLGLLTYRVEAGGVAVVIIKACDHGVFCRVTHTGGGGIIGINLHENSSFWFYPVVS